MRLSNGTAMNLNDDNPGERIKILLSKGFYFHDKRDIDLISSVVANGKNKAEGIIENIGELNKSKYNVSIDDAYLQGGEEFKKRVQVERSLLGFADEDSFLYEKERRKPSPLPAGNDLAMGNGAINGAVLKANKLPVPGVLVRLRLILPQDSLYSEGINDVDSKARVSSKSVRKVYAIDSLNNRQLQSLSAYARTNNDGKFSFSGLPQNNAFAVLPLQPGYQFGRSQGVQKLDNNAAFTFYQAPNTIKLFSTRDFNALKKEKSIIVRTPDEVIQWFWIIVISFIASFWLLHVLLAKRFPQADQFILPVIMLLTGLSFLTLFSLQDPLRDRFFAKSTLTYFGCGILGIIILMLFNLKKFTTDSALYRLFIFQNARRAADGWPWALMAMGLLVLTIVFGAGPEGSGVKVNLLGFQPSEIVKFLVIIFLAGFFAANEKYISEYTSWHKRFSFFFFALFAIIATILLFLILGDLGPAMVCCFHLYYSFLILTWRFCKYGWCYCCLRTFSMGFTKCVDSYRNNSRLFATLHVV
jgi:hypothetical protein